MIPPSFIGVILFTSFLLSLITIVDDSSALPTLPCSFDMSKDTVVGCAIGVGTLIFPHWTSLLPVFSDAPRMKLLCQQSLRHLCDMLPISLRRLIGMLLSHCSLELPAGGISQPVRCCCRRRHKNRKSRSHYSCLCWKHLPFGMAICARHVNTELGIVKHPCVELRWW